MPVPAKTSAEWLDRYALGECIAASAGPVWQGVRLAVMALPKTAPTFSMPAVSEPFLAWISSGTAEAQERERGRPWVTTRLKRDSLFLTAGGPPYDFRWRTLSDEPFEVVLVLLSLPLFEEALAEVLGRRAEDARLVDLSGFEDPSLTALLRQLMGEATRKTASRLAVRGLAQAIAVHLARNYTVLARPAHGQPVLPGYLVRRITEWMSQNPEKEPRLVDLAAMAGLSEFHFSRLFKRATGLPPLRYHAKLRIDLARRLLRETAKRVIEVANEVGYANPSSFAQAFRRETGLSPREYRKDR